MKRLIAASLCIVLVLSLLTACGKSQEVPQTDGSDSMNNSSSTDQGTNPYTHYYSEGIHLTQNFFVDELLVEQVPEGMTFDDNYRTNWCEEAFGITWSSSWIATTPGQNEQKLNLAMVSGDLPDLIIGTGKSLTPMIEGGMVIPLDSLIEQYASPLVKHLMTQMEEATNGSYSDPFSKDGKLYGIPMMADLWATSWNNNWIRRDIIEELGVTTPTTLADLEAIIEKYIAAYPNGYAMLMYAGGSMDTVMEAYGAFPSRWIKDSEGSLVYGSVQPEVKEGLAKLREWYQKSWIDQEFVVKDFSKASEDLVAGNVLSFHGSWGSVWWPFPDMMAVNPEADMVAYAPLTQADGSMKTVLYPTFNSDSKCFAINVKCTSPEALIYLLNANVDNMYRNSEDMRKLMKELYDYDLMYEPYEVREPLNADATSPGAYTYDYPEGIDGPVLNGYGETHGIYFSQGPRDLVDQYIKLSDVEKGVLPQSDLTLLDTIEKDKYTQPQNRWAALMSSVDLYRGLEDKDIISYSLFTGAPTQGMTDSNAYLKKLEQETFSKIIMGQVPLDEFDTFVQNWKSSGGDQITNEVNEWYSSR